MRLSIIIPTYNGLSLLQRHLPSLLAAEGVVEAELLIADDGSSDGTADWLTKNIPQARIVRQEITRGFSSACNAAIEAATGDALLLLNNDVEVMPNFLPPLVEALQSSEDVFAVNSRILLPSRKMMDEGEKVGAFHHGIFYVDCLRASSVRTAPTLYATACAALYRRDRVAALGGFDELLSPFYWEDVDLSYRALRRGWTVLYEPRSVVYHEHETTTSRLDPEYKSMIRDRNQFLFVWKNMTDLRLTAQSLMLGAAVAWQHAVRRHDRSLWNGYRAALSLWPEVSARRAIERRDATVTDLAILTRFTGVATGQTLP